MAAKDGRKSKKIGRKIGEEMLARVRCAEVDACAVAQWAPAFAEDVLPFALRRLSEEEVKYLHSDGVALPGAAADEDEEDEDEADEAEQGAELGKDEDEDEDEEEQEDEEQAPVRRTSLVVCCSTRAFSRIRGWDAETVGAAGAGRMDPRDAGAVWRRRHAQTELERAQGSAWSRTLARRECREGREGKG